MLHGRRGQGHLQVPHLRQTASDSRHEFIDGVDLIVSHTKALQGDGRTAYFTFLWGRVWPYELSRTLGCGTPLSAPKRAVELVLCVDRTQGDLVCKLAPEHLLDTP